MADKKEEDLTKKGVFDKIKDKILPDEEEPVSYTHLTLPTKA